MIINQVDSIQSNGGAVSNKAVGTALVVSGCAVSTGWSLASTIHTTVAAPAATIGSWLGAAALAGAGLAVSNRKPVEPAATQTVNVSAAAV